MNKRTDFLWLVQMIVISHPCDVASVGADAIAASYRIPEDMSAREAALGFCACMVKGFSEDRSCPYWMTELSDPN